MKEAIVINNIINWGVEIAHKNEKVLIADVMKVENNVVALIRKNGFNYMVNFSDLQVIE